MANAGGTTSKTESHQLLVARGELGTELQVWRECLQDYIRYAEGSNPNSPGNRRAARLATLVALFFNVTQRMRMELQTLNLVVAGSNPAGSKSGEP